jgi:hypothetical protein
MFRIDRYIATSVRDVINASYRYRYELAACRMSPNDVISLIQESHDPFRVIVTMAMMEDVWYPNRRG